MNEIVQQRAAVRSNWINVILGIWVVISPFVLGFSNLRAAMWNNVATGLAVLLLTLSRSERHSAAPSVLNVLLGAWLIISGFVMVFSIPVGFWNNVVLGIIIPLVALTATARPPRPVASAAPPR